MTRFSRYRRSGQVLIMVTLALFAMCGMLGLLVDLGWSYFVRKSAQAAADAAALAAVKKAMDDASDLGSYNCDGGVVTCTAEPIPCPASGNLESACLYAARHGFSTSNQRQNVMVQASDRFTPPTVIGCAPTVSHPPTADPPCIDTYYWVTVRVAERIPQLFSSIFGNTTGTISARATAAVARAQAIGSLILINRQGDPWIETTGTNLYVGGTPTVHVPGGILLASNAGGPGHKDPWAGFISGGGTVEAPYTYIRTGGGHYINSASGSWLAIPENRPDGSYFYDPMRDKGGQPPVTQEDLDPIPVMGGTLNMMICPDGVCPEGNYFATGPQPGCNQNCPTVATGDPIRITTNVTFQANGGKAFGDFHFFGGLEIAQVTVTFNPGRYVLAGVKNETTPVFNNDNKAMLLGGSQNDPGRIFILTDSTYPGLEKHVNSIPVPRYWHGPENRLLFSKASIKAGNNVDSRVELYGLDRKSPSLPEELEPFSPVVIWQDQRNSYVKYTTDGKVDISCGSHDEPCMNEYPAPPSISPQLEIWATPYAKYDGVIYQPRGAWTLLQASGDYRGALRIVSGALKTQGSGNLTLVGPARPIINYVIALVE